MIWMILTAFFGMTLKFVEVSLGHKYRVIHKDGTVSGGAIRYLSSGLEERGLPKLGKILALVFAICCIGGSFGGGNMFQANQAFQQIVEASGGVESPLYQKGWLGGLIFAFVVGLIILGGIKSIGRVTEKLVPSGKAVLLKPNTVPNLEALAGRVILIVSMSYSGATKALSSFLSICC